MKRRVFWGSALLALTVAATLTADVNREEALSAAAAPARAELRAISTRLEGARSQVLIEASEPVGYVTSQPDPLTVIVDLRNVKGGMMPPGILGPLPPVADVRVEEAVAGDGAEVARVRVKLAYAAKHIVRASRNVIYVDVDRAVVAHETTAMPGLERAPIAAAIGPKSGPSSSPSSEGRGFRQGIGSGASPSSSTSETHGVSALQRSAAPPPPAADASVPPGPESPAVPRFQGHPVTFDFQGADLRSVLRTFAEISGLNIVIDPAITGSVDVSLKDVPWDQALDIILKANKLGYSVDGTVVRISPMAVLAQEEEERRKLSEAQALAGELRVVTLPLSYAKAPELVSILTRSALSPRGEVQVDTRTNTLIVRDLADRLATASELVKALDRPQPQVEIEARIVQTTRDFARALGVEWGVHGRVDPALGNTTSLAFPNRGSVSGRSGGVQGPVQGDSSADRAVDLGVPAATSALGIALGAVNGAMNLDVVLSQLESSGRGRLLSTPRVSTQNNIEAEMTQGVQIPIQTVANNTVTVSFKDAALTLKVTPQITASNTIIMRVFLENATPDFSRAVNGIPPIDTQRAVTTVLVADGETTVLGGIYVSIEQASHDRVPMLHRIPLLGWLFKRDINSDESRELLIFITPRITKS
jgi:type IV pilus assembly protein PilQ